MQTEQKTQVQLASEVLTQEIYPSVTTEDRRAAMEELEIGQFTLIQYLKGRVTNLDTAMKLIQFLRRRIEDRQKELVKNGR